MNCKTCRWLDVAPDKSGKVVVRSAKAYQCKVEVPMPVLPASITNAYGFSWPPAKTRMSRNDGQNCPYFALRQATGEKGSP